jgi:CheY-like chemotaxis protein
VNDLRHLGLKILVVEDNEINMFVAVSFLEMLGVSVEKAVDGAQGLEKILKYKYDLVLLDLQMPELHGFEVVAEVRGRQDSYFQKLPIVALTATSSPNLKQEVQQKGMNDILSKPFELESLQQIILNNVPSQLYSHE